MGLLSIWWYLWILIWINMWWIIDQLKRHIFFGELLDDVWIKHTKVQQRDNKNVNLICSKWLIWYNAILIHNNSSHINPNLNSELPLNWAQSHLQNACDLDHIALIYGSHCYCTWWYNFWGTIPFLKYNKYIWHRKQSNIFMTNI